MIQGAMGLTIRAPEKTSSNLVTKLSPRTIGRWINQLPIANVSESSRLIYQMLLECNKSALSDEDRFKILTELNAPVQLILKSLGRHFTGNTLNLTDKQRKIAALVQAIHTEMAIGFKIVIENQAAHPSFLGKNMVLGAMFFALEYLALTVVRCYQVYTDVPSRIWREINIIYKFAIDHKQDTKKCTAEGFKQDHSILDIVKKLSLLSIANPYQLRQQEIERVYEGLQRYLPLVDFDLANRFENRYVLDLNSSLPPTHQALKKFRPSRYTFALNLDQVIRELQNTIKDQTTTTKKSVAVGGLSERMIRHLLTSWAHLSSRNFSRTPCAGHVMVSVGLNATHQLLNPDDDEPPETLTEYEGSLKNATLVEDFRTQEMLSSFGNDSFRQETSKEDVWAKLYRPKEAIQETEEIDYTAAFNQQRLPTSHNYHFIDADLINMSPGGYCIQFNENPPTNTQTGEVIGLVEVDSDGLETWHIGVIRWLKRSKSPAGVQLGIQLIAPGASPVVGHLELSGQQPKSQNSLLLPELKGIGQPATLLTSVASFAPKQKITIFNGEEEFTARLTKVVASTPSYKQFIFERLETTNKTNKPQSSSLDNTAADGFDSVWDLI